MSTPPQITVESALETIDQALATINTNRAGHIALQQCVEVLRKALESPVSAQADAEPTSLAAA